MFCARIWVQWSLQKAPVTATETSKFGLHCTHLVKAVLNRVLVEGAERTKGQYDL